MDLIIVDEVCPDNKELTEKEITTFSDIIKELKEELKQERKRNEN